MDEALKRRIFDTLIDHGATYAEVLYNGGHDEGGIDSISLVLEDGSHKELKYKWVNRNYNYERREWVQTEKLEPEVQEENDLWDLLGGIVYSQWGSFAGEFYVEGTIEYDVAGYKITKSENVEVPSWEQNTEEW